MTCFGWVSGIRFRALEFYFALIVVVLGVGSVQTAAADPIRILFLGDQGHHHPSDLYRVLGPALSKYSIELVYSEDVAGSLTPARLRAFDGLLIYANIDNIGDTEERALLEYVAEGHGLIPLHCASYCFRNSEAYVQLVGAQFKEHSGERFATHITAPEHPIMRGFGGFESWDETYIHHRHHLQDRIVLEERRQGPQARGVAAEPWTWVRTHGRGRVFYTAWGHDMNTWRQEGFQNLVARGSLWACGRDASGVPSYIDPKRFDAPRMTTLSSDVAPFEYIDVGKEIPNYTPGGKWGTQGEPRARMQQPLEPSESIKHYSVPEGFRMALWASEEIASGAEMAGAGLAGKPIAMAWDERGRLWLCETVDYPNELQPQGNGRDRIRICEDTDRDGIADKFVVFATRLSIPTAIVCFQGGALVQDGTKTVYLKDLDGDDRADFRQELITGWAMGDTHGGVSNFQFGLDNWFWGMQGYNDSHPIINGQSQQGFRQGFWRFAVEPAPSEETSPAFEIRNGIVSAERTSKHDNQTLRVTKLEFMRSTNNNTWGFGISEDGLIFGSTANGNPSIFMPIANRYYERVSGWSPEVLSNIADSSRFAAITEKVRQVDHHGGYTAAAGHALYTARNYPKSWWNRVAFVCEPTGHLVGSFVLSRDEADVRSTSPFNLVASDDEWAAPIMAEVGPDGNVWILDWYNFIVQHNPTPHGFETGKGNAYETKLRDKKFGRIYRIVYEGNEGKPPSLNDAAELAVRSGLKQSNEAACLAALAHPNMFWRRTAQRLLVEKNDFTFDGVRTLEKMVRNQAVDDVGINAGAIHAIWVLAAKNRWKGNIVAEAMRHPSAAVRRNAIAAAVPNTESANFIAENRSVLDPDGQVRLAAMLCLADCPAGSPNLEDLLSVADFAHVDTEDKTRQDRWLLDAWTSAASAHSQRVLPGLINKQELSDSILQRLSIVAEHAARNRIDARMLESLIAENGSPKATQALVFGLAKGWPRNHDIDLSETVSDRLVRYWLAGELSLETKSQVIQLAGSLGIDSLGNAMSLIRGQLQDRIANRAIPAEARIAAAKQMMILEPDRAEAVDGIMAQLNPQAPPELTRGFVQALGLSKSKTMATQLLERGVSMPPEFLKDTVRMMLGRPESTFELIEAIAAGKLAVQDLQLDQRQLLREHPDPKIRERAVAVLQASGGIPNADRQKLVESWLAITHESGDAVNGKAVYEKHCSLCHRHGDLGNNIGPNLTGMSVHPKAELLAHILDPNRNVEGNFRTYNIQTSDGGIVTGMMTGETKTSIEITNVQGKREVVLREDIERLTSSQKSLMPEGFESQIEQSPMRDLLEFLTSKGKYVPLSIGSVASVITTRGMFFDPEGEVERLVFSDWAPKLVGEVPFVLVDPLEDRIPNAILLYGPNGKVAPRMPKELEIPCNTSATAIHFLGGVGGWSFPASREGTVSMIVRIHYEDGDTEDHPLINGQHFADYIRRVDVPGSEFAFDLAGRQLRYFSLRPVTKKMIRKISLIKGDDPTAPIVMAMTLQTQD
jgi:putative membrane-bound dehydrogenase-like protein